MNALRNVQKTDKAEREEELTRIEKNKHTK